MTALNMPTVKVWVDFDHDPMSSAYTWTNLTRRSWDFSMTRGRAYELTQMQPGTAKVTMENVDGALDPTNTSSPYSPNVLPFRRVKVEAQWPATVNLLDRNVATGTDTLGTTAGFTIGAASSLISTTNANSNWNALNGGSPLLGGAKTLGASIPNGTAIFAVLYTVAKTYDVAAGELCTFSAYLAPDAAMQTAGIGAYVQIMWLDDTGATLGSFVAGNVVTTAGRSIAAGTAPAGTSGVLLRVQINAANTSGGGVTLYADGFQLERGGTATGLVLPGIPYPVFSMLAERWPMEWQDNLSVSPVECTDVFAILANKDLRSAVLSEMLLDAPSALYPLDETAGSSSAGDLTGNMPAASVKVSQYGAGTLTFGAQTGITGAASGMSMTSPDVDTVIAPGIPAERATWLEVPNAVAGSVGYAMELWFLGPASIPAHSAETILEHDTFSISILAAGSGNDGQLDLDIFGFAAVFSPGSVCDGQVHHLVYEQASNGLSATLYVDDVATSAAFGSAAPAISAGPLRLGIHTFQSGVQFPYGGTLALSAQYPAPLGATRVGQHFLAGTTAFAGETADDRISRLLAYAGWTGPSALDACSTTVLAADAIAGQKGLTAIQAVATSEGGAFFIGRDGTPTYQSRRTRMANISPVATFGDGPGELPYESIAFDYDPTYVYNDIELTRASGPSAAATDATSVDRYGPRSLPQQMDIADDNELVDAAAWLLASYKDPHVRVASITLHPSAVTSVDLWTACLSLDIGSRVTVNRRPKGTTNPNPISGDYFVEQVVIQSWTADDAVFRIALSPIPIQALIADDPVFGLADSDSVAAW